MSESPGFSFNAAMWVPIAGWVYLGVGMLWPFESGLLQFIWWVDLFLSVVVHAAQIHVALPIGLHHGFSKLQSAVYTFVFGATWWRPLQVQMHRQLNG